jgi:hypothetical protein
MRLKLIFLMVLMVGVVLLQPFGATRVMAAVSEGCKAVNEVGGPHTERVGEDEAFDLTTVLKTITNLPFKKGDQITLKWEVTNKTGSTKFPSKGEFAKINDGDPNAGPKDANKIGDGSLTVEVQTKGNASFKAQVIITEEVRKKAWVIRWSLTCTPSTRNDAPEDNGGDDPAPTDEATVTQTAEPTTPTDQPTTEPSTAVPPASPTSQPTAEVTAPPAPTIEPTIERTTEPTPLPPTEPITEPAPVETAQPAE